MNSSLGQEHRLVALDLRGHGLSEKPRGGYDDSTLWADDLNAVIQTLDLERPVLSGWSYGPFVVLDYIRRYGEERIGGLQFVGAITKLGSEDAISVLSPEFLTIVPQLFATDSETSVSGLTTLLQLCFAEKPSTTELYLMLGYNVCVPPYVRQGLLSRSIGNDDLLPKLRKPVLITHGERDAIVKMDVVTAHKAAIPHAQVQLVPGAGHAVFWDDAAGFNERLHAFCENL